jgi:hypothetical protein
VRPHGGVLVNYHACLPSHQVENNHVKVIANTQHLLAAGDDPHSAFYKTKGKFTVNELGEKVRGAKTLVPSHTKIALHHYLTKSRAEFAAKVRLGSAAGHFKTFEFFNAIEELANATCADAVPLGLRCCPSVRHEMAAAAERAQAAAAGVRPGAGGGGGGGGGGTGGWGRPRDTPGGPGAPGLPAGQVGQQRRRRRHTRPRRAPDSALSG